MDIKRQAAVRTVSEIRLKPNLDDRGALIAVAGGVDVPFEIARCYFMYDVLGPRGGHAHRTTEQIVIAVAGWCRIRVSDGVATEEFVLDSPASGVYIGPMTWIEVPIFSPQAVVLVLASTHYDNKKVIRDWHEFLREKAALK